MKKIIMILTLVMIVVACGNKQEQSPLVVNYLAVKDALVLTDGAKARVAAQKFMDWNKDPQLVMPLNAIANSQDVNIQREAFEYLSELVYKTVMKEGSSTPLYKQFCPMAFNNKGAYWLAAEMEVNNPYFGDVMLHCGSVQEKVGG